MSTSAGTGVNIVVPGPDNALDFYYAYDGQAFHEQTIGPGTSTTSSGPTGPVVTKPVTTIIPLSGKRRSLRVKLWLSWTWSHRTTWLRKVRVGRFPGRTRLSVGCRGRGCPRHFAATAIGGARLHRLVRRLSGKRFRAGDVLSIALTAPGYRSERAQIVIRDGRLPRTKSLSR